MPTTPPRWDQRSDDAAFLTELVESGRVTATTTARDIVEEHSQFKHYKIKALQSALNRIKNVNGVNVRGKCLATVIFVF
jgi:hypothetical protein